MNGKTVIVGVSPNQTRYSFAAAELLLENQIEFVPIGMKRGSVLGRPILDIRTKPVIEDVETITFYIRPELQSSWQDYLISLKPKRMIFNPGTENNEFEQMAESVGIEVIEACTLVMLRTGQY